MYSLANAVCGREAREKRKSTGKTQGRLLALGSDGPSSGHGCPKVDLGNSHTIRSHHQAVCAGAELILPSMGTSLVTISLQGHRTWTLCDSPGVTGNPEKSQAKLRLRTLPPLRAGLQSTGSGEPGVPCGGHTFDR